MLLMRVRARARARGGGGGGEGGVAKAGERETERRRGQRHGKEKTVPRFKVSCFGGRGPARAARPEIERGGAGVIHAYPLALLTPPPAFPLPAKNKEMQPTTIIGPHHRVHKV